jgi:hypothetical protein
MYLFLVFHLQFTNETPIVMVSLNLNLSHQELIVQAAFKLQ